MRARSRWIALVAVACATWLMFALGAGVASARSHKSSAHAKRAASATPKLARAPHSTGRLTYLGTVNLKQLAAAQAKSSPSGATRGELPRDKSGSTSRAARLANPNPPADKLVNLPGTNGFFGLNAADSAQVNGFDLEPPDQGLCAHNNQVMEAVNLVLDVYTEGGQRLMQPVSLNTFFGLPPYLNTVNGHTTYGPFLSDPRCYYDKQTGRWFVSILEISSDQYTGALMAPAYELIAVSASSDPTGNYGLFELPATMDGSNGTPNLPNCPCFGDQPRIGADANGFYISADIYSINNASANSNGGFLWAVSKRLLANAASSGGQGTPPFVGIWLGAVTIGGYPANAVQPAEVPPGAAYPPNREYFLSTPDFNGFATSGGHGASSVVEWTLLNTSSLNSANPSLTLEDAIVPSEPFTPPNNPAQKPGPHPLGQSLGEPVEPLNADDDRMQQTQYVNGMLYSSLETGIGSGSGRTGTAWFQLAAAQYKVVHQGYVAAANGASTLYPAIGLLANSHGALTFSVDGPGNYPSAAYIPFYNGPTGSTIYISQPGTLPEDGFTCYPQFGGPPCRWGDYSAATSDGSGRIVMGDEMIANLQRTQLANWDTFISFYKP